MDIQNKEYDLPCGWLKTNLNVIAYINMGQSPPSYSYNLKKTGLPFFQGKTDFGNMYPTVRVYCSLPMKTVEQGDVLISVRAPIGPTNLVSEKSCIGRGLAGIRCYGKISNKFILYYIRANENKIARLGTGTTFKAISKQILETLEIPLPPLDEQYRIVEKIEELFSEIEHAEKTLSGIKNRLDIYWQSILDDTFNSINGDTKYLSSLTTFIGAGSTPKGGRSIYVKNGVPFIRSQNVLRYSLNLEETVYITDEINEKMSRTKIQANDVLLNITGASIGRCAYIPEHFNQGNVNQHVCIIRTSPDLSHKYLALYLNSPKVQRMIQELSSGATREALTLSQINSISIPVCSFTEQELIVAELESKYTVLKNVEETTVKKLAQIEVLKQTILYKAFAGELVSQNPDDEPAYKLLDKIKLERLEFLQNKPKENKISTKIEKMERTKSVLDLLKEAKEPIPAKEVWQQSKHWESIDNFYAELKSISELIEQTKSKTEILLSLKK